MTYSNTSTNPTTSKRGWMAPVIAGVAGLAVGGLVATGITVAAIDTPTGSQADCVAAIGHADEAIEIYSQGFVHAADAIDAYMVNDYSAMDRSTQNINDAANNLEPVLMDYYTASNVCMGGGTNG